MNSFLDACRNWVRAVMRSVAKLLNIASGGHISPNFVTIVGLITHAPIAWLIATSRHNLLAAFLLVIFGLFDALDGELARLQKRASAAGMLLDATTDRMKEIILYVGIAAAIMNQAPRYGESYYGNISTDVFYGLLAVVVACGSSLLVSYVKAKGETVVAGGKLSANEVNRLFQDGLFRFEIRMFVLVIGLLSNQIIVAVIIMAIMSSLTAIGRLVKISRKLS